MHENYKDITSRIKEAPRWYDQNGVPRYDIFHPDYCPNIYSNQVVLLRIACQACLREFDVEMHSPHLGELGHPKKLHYGDPPAHDCIGDSMNCDDLEVLQVWYRSCGGGWKRHAEFEGQID